MDKLDRILDALNDSGKYSDEELKKLVGDREGEEIFRLLDITKSSVTDCPEIDTDSEWSSFCKMAEKRRRSPFQFFRRRNIAVVAGLLIVTTVAIGATVGIIFIKESPSKVENIENEAPITGELMTISTGTEPDTLKRSADFALNTIVFENRQLEEILNDMAKFYGKEVVYNSNSSKSLRLYLRWDQAQSVEESIDMLNNFEHINIRLNTNKIIVE